MNTSLDARLSGVLGGRTAAAFEKGLGLVTVGDLIGHYPRRYARRGELTALAGLRLDESVTIVAEVLEVRERSMKAKRGSILEVRIGDGKGFLTLTFFNQPWRSRELRPGARGIFAGKVGEYRGARQLAHPDYELFDSEEAGTEDSAAEWAEQPIPLYPATASVASWQLQKALAVVLDTLPVLADPVPDSIRAERGLLAFAEAVELVHRPRREQDWRAARDSLRFQEAFVLQSALLQQRQSLHRQSAVARIPKDDGLLARFDSSLPFQLTEDQQAVGRRIAADLAATTPMNRLLQGEVASGKTVVALRAMLAVADSGGQSALLAPTEVLAGQHLRSIVKTLGPDLAAAVRPVLLTGQLATADRKRALLAAASGQSRIIVGTHALIGDKVGFDDLGLVVVDEQHRFGVDQREALRRKGATPPHVLVLTATPIPRTVAMTVFGDLDVSTIAELPAGRPGIETFVVPASEKPGWVQRVWERLGEELAQGRQAFVVCPAIEDGEAGQEEAGQADADQADAGGADAGQEEAGQADAAPDAPPDAPPSAAPATAARPAVTNVTDILAELRSHPLLASARIEALHGRLPSEVKDATMRAFAGGEIDILVATTVIEVGVDVANASAMVVLDADRFGISQLHQLRGRVGRGASAGLCLMVTRAPAGSIARERVEAVAATLDGFALAEKDLELRREGDVLGAGQSGARSSLRLLRVADHGELIAAARELAIAVFEGDPELSEHPALREALTRRLDDASRDFLAKN
ncbi:MAG: ATP-dependent DNA helicase RecG [Microbacteriaceae bacterium]